MRIRQGVQVELLLSLALITFTATALRLAIFHQTNHARIDALHPMLARGFVRNRARRILMSAGSKAASGGVSMRRTMLEGWHQASRCSMQRPGLSGSKPWTWGDRTYNPERPGTRSVSQRPIPRLAANRLAGSMHPCRERCSAP